MASKKTTHRESKTQVENSAQKLKKEGRAHQKGEIISRDELEKRGGLTGDPTALLAVYLHKFEEGEAHVNYSKKLKDLAEHIYEKEILCYQKSQTGTVGRGRKTGERESIKQVLTKIIVQVKCKLYF